MEFYKWERFPEITAVTTLRTDGNSVFPYASNNLAFHVGDELEKVQANRAKTFAALNITEKNIVLTKQSHSDVTLFVTNKDGGAGYDNFEEGAPADALYTKTPNLTLGVYHADCVPVFIYVPKHKIVGIIHAGEEGSVADITGKFIKTLVAQEKVEPTEIYAFIGPSLSFSHRIITAEKAEQYARKGGELLRSLKATSGKYFIDLPLLNFLQLRKHAIPVQNIELSKICTFVHSEKYFSYAKEVTTGRNLSLIKLN